MVGVLGKMKIYVDPKSDKPMEPLSYTASEDKDVAMFYCPYNPFAGPHQEIEDPSIKRLDEPGYVFRLKIDTPGSENAVDWLMKNLLRDQFELSHEVGTRDTIVKIFDEKSATLFRLFCQ